MSEKFILLRGGSWFFISGLCRSAFRAFRNYLNPDNINFNIGLRVVAAATKNTISRKSNNREKTTMNSKIIQLTDKIIIPFAHIPRGKFLMGSPEGEGHEDEHPQHLVTIDYDFYAGETPITQEQWTWVAKNLPQTTGGIRLDPEPFKFKENPKYPAESISWDMAIEFCKRLSEFYEEEVRLPSEAEWEYFARAGTTTRFNVGDILTKKDARFDSDSPCDVGSFAPNKFGLYDIHGNVWEWCRDDWHENYLGAPTDGSAWIDEE